MARRSIADVLLEPWSESSAPLFRSQREIARAVAKAASKKQVGKYTNAASLAVFLSQVLRGDRNCPSKLLELLEKVAGDVATAPGQPTKDEIKAAFKALATHRTLVDRIRDQTSGEYWIVAPELLMAFDDEHLGAVVANIREGAEYVFCSAHEPSLLLAHRRVEARLREISSNNAVINGRIRIMKGPRYLNLLALRIVNPTTEGIVEHIEIDESELRLRPGRSEEREVTGAMAREVLDIFRSIILQLDSPGGDEMERARLAEYGRFQLLWDSHKLLKPPPEAR